MLIIPLFYTSYYNAFVTIALAVFKNSLLCFSSYLIQAAVHNYQLINT